MTEATFHGPADRTRMAETLGLPHIMLISGMWRVFTVSRVGQFHCPTFPDACRAARIAFAGQGGVRVASRAPRAIRSSMNQAT